MADNNIQIIKRVVSIGREFYREGIFGVADSLNACSDAGMNPLFIPELATARADADKESRLWKTSFSTPSVRVIGRSRQGNPVVVYAHVPTSLSDPVNIKKLINDKVLVNSAGPMPEDEFYALLDKGGNERVFVVDYDKLRESISGVISIDEALAHPQTIPFLGGEQIAQAYLAKYRYVYGNRIGVWHRIDLNDKPMGRVLFVGNSVNDGLLGCDLDDDGRVAGVAPNTQVVHEEEGLEDKVEVLHDGQVLRRQGILYIPLPAGLGFRS